VCGSLLGAAIGTVLSVLVGFSPGVASLAALTAMIMLPLLRVFHPPGVASAMCPALLHCGAWFAILVVLPFTLAAVISCAVLSRLQLAAITRSFLGCVSDQSRILCAEKRRVDAEA
jgi:HPP family